MQKEKFPQKTVIIASAVAVLACIALGVAFFFQRKEVVQPSGSTQAIKSIEVSSIDKTKSYGSIWVENRKIVTNVSDIMLLAYITANKSQWETATLEYPTEKRLPNGSSWFGTTQTNIDSSDYLIAIYVLLDKDFGNKYDFHLVNK